MCSNLLSPSLTRSGRRFCQAPPEAFRFNRTRSRRRVADGSIMMARTSTSPKSAKLDEFLCFALYSANLAFGRAYRPILDKVGLTYTQYVALVALSEVDEQTVGELGEKLFLESNTLTPI